MSSRPPAAGATAGTPSPDAAIGVAALVAVVAVVSALLLLRGGDDSAPGSAAAAQGMAHVHGLGIDPADGALYAGTHYGLFRVPEQGDAEPIAGRVQDFMGFTVAGPGHYLASGHPGEGETGPAALGLIETTDGGQSWQTLSLEGEADFHALEARHGRIYGSDGGALMVTSDGHEWQTRARIGLADLAVSPDDPDTILATTEQGLGLSTDGGATFGGVRGAPMLQLVTWTEGGTLVGVDPRGGVHVSDDGGTTWQERGSAGGPPSAVTATDEEVYVAVGERILVSDDGGATFEVRYAEG